MTFADDNSTDRAADPAARAPGFDEDPVPAGGPIADDSGVDPELESDLGPELELRGDVMESELKQAKVQAAEMKALAQRLQAEFENFRKRMAREREDERNRAAERVVEELLPALDNLERAIDHTTAGGDLKHLLGGVEAVHTQILGVLAKEGATPIDPFGQPFDPMKHHAVAQKEDPEVPEGTVVEVYQKGYEMHGRVMRSAMVVVSTGGPSGGE